jgi:hypothetical protein
MARSSVLLTVYLSGAQVNNTERGRACSTNGASRSVYRVLGGEPEGKRPLGRPWNSWEDNIKMDLREVRWGI